jgi:hypothetical protein
MWNMKCVIIPVINAATRIVRKVLKKNLDVILEKHLTDPLQKTAIPSDSTHNNFNGKYWAICGPKLSGPQLRNQQTGAGASSFTTHTNSPRVYNPLHHSED